MLLASSLPKWSEPARNLKVATGKQPGTFSDNSNGKSYTPRSLNRLFNTILWDLFDFFLILSCICFLVVSSYFTLFLH